MAWKVDRAANNFVFIHLIEQEPCLYDRNLPDYARQDPIDFISERISKEMKESGMYVFSN
jgi:hypothetical protein